MMAKGTPGVKVEFTKTGKPVKHGTLTAYTRRACRCGECVEAQKDYSRKYNEENREERREYSRKYNEENREKRREYGRKYREENREGELERARKYREENREKRREYSRKYHEENRGAAQLRSARYCALQKERSRFTASVATRARQPWTEWEDARLMSEPASMSLALEMGRSLKSIRCRKAILNKKLRELEANGAL